MRHSGHNQLSFAHTIYCILEKETQPSFAYIKELTEYIDTNFSATKPPKIYK